MSAFICNDKHIGQLALYYVKHLPTWSSNTLTAQDIANKLLATNIESVNHRYDSNEPLRACKMPKHLKVKYPSHIISMCNCMNYQSSELPEWEDTSSYQLIQGIREAAISALCDSAKDKEGTAPWEYEG